MLDEQTQKVRPFNLNRWFLISSCVSILIIIIISSLLLSRFLTDNMLHRDAVVTEAFVQGLIKNEDPNIYFEGTDSEIHKARIENIFNNIALMPEVVRVNIYDRVGTVLWSDDARFINHNFMPNPELIIALSGSIAISSGISGKPIKGEHVFDKEVPFFVEIYIPIWDKTGNKVLGAFETYKEPLTLFNAIKKGKRLVWTIAVLGGVFLYASLFWIFRRAAFIIRVQKEQDGIKDNMIRTDTLTGVLSLRAFMDDATLALAAAARHKYPVSLGFIDLDEFKSLNDSMGHAEGDKALQATGAELKSVIRKSDLCARLGGDEFVVLLSHTDQSGAQIFFERLHGRLLRAMEINGWDVGFTIGVAIYEEGSADLKKAIKRADELMLKTKKESKNAVVYEVFSNTNANANQTVER